MKMLLFIPCIYLFLSSFADAQDYDYVTDCPEPTGFFADALQCDRYYECQDGEVSEHLCPDGLVFDETSHSFAKCSFPFSIPCNGRNELQPPQPSRGCPRLNGYFPDPDPTVCDVFHFCSDGVPHRQQCPGGLIFDPSLGQCGWGDQVNRKGCTSKDLIDFQCPDQNPDNTDYTRHADPKDCNIFYLCISGQPRKSRCGQGLVFKEETLSCERQETVEGFCSTWFNQTYLDVIFAPVSSTDASFRRDRPERPDRPRTRRPQASPSNDPIFDLRRPPATTTQRPLPPQLALLAQNSQLGFSGQDRQRIRTTARPQFIPQQAQETFGGFEGSGIQVEDPRDRFTRPPLASRRPFATEEPARRQPETFNARRPATQFNARQPSRQAEVREPDIAFNTRPEPDASFSSARNPTRPSQFDARQPETQFNARNPTRQSESQFDSFDTQFNREPEPQFSSFTEAPARRPETQFNARNPTRDNDFNFGNRGNLPRAPIRQRPSNVVDEEPETLDEPQTPAEGGFGLRRRVPISGTRLQSGGRRGVAKRRRPQPTSDTQDQLSTTRSEGRLEVTNIDLPPLRPIDEIEDVEDIPQRSRLPQQRFRGRQS